ncbi:MAG: hypothetical protein MNSN_10630 [Minisyncoccus archaeiphilus]|uniref:DUF389 domain-containing protein n=1 Tax=Minisyncoccus archaeiphilus TaxID=3238481 RepID=UPI002B16F594|nr:MAG: hypothetical protein MNSN_10630 [Candidatus Parcubacteria bacterium]
MKKEKSIEKRIPLSRKINEKFKEIFGLSISNDLLDNGDSQYTETRLKESAKITVSFLVLLIASSVICTLGLLQSSTSVIIGGMIISPIMWPLMKVSFGISFEKVTYIRHAIFMLILSILVGLISSTIITLLSPLKSITPEILARTNPNILDIIIAIAGGLIAAIGISKPKISETLSGVAIATSLMPPLCVGGIGLALLDWKISLSGLFLFLENAVAIIFVAIVTFIILLKPIDRAMEIKRKGFMIVAALLLVISIPSMIFLFDQSTRLKTYTNIQEVININFKSISPSIRLSPAKIELVDGKTMDISFEALMPEDMSISYIEQERLRNDLERLTNKTINLEIYLQRIISTVKKEEIELQTKKDLAQKTLLELINGIDGSLIVNSFSFEKNDNGSSIKAMLIGEPGTLFTEEDRNKIEKDLSDKLGENILLNIEIIERKTLLAKPKVEEMYIKQRVSQLINSRRSEGVSILNVTVKKLDTPKDMSALKNEYTINIEMKVLQGTLIEENFFHFIKNQLEAEFRRGFKLEIFINEYKNITI